MPCHHHNADGCCEPPVHTLSPRHTSVSRDPPLSLCHDALDEGRDPTAEELIRRNETPMKHRCIARRGTEWRKPVLLLLQFNLETAELNDPSDNPDSGPNEHAPRRGAPPAIDEQMPQYGWTSHGHGQTPSQIQVRSHISKRLCPVAHPARPRRPIFAARLRIGVGCFRGGALLFQTHSVGGGSRREERPARCSVTRSPAGATGPRLPVRRRRRRSPPRWPLRRRALH